MSLIKNLEEVNVPLANAAVIKHWFKCDELTADDSIVDAVNGISAPTFGTTTLTNNGDGSISVKVGTPQDIVGTLSQPGALDFVLFGVAQSDATISQVSLGGATQTINVLFGAGNSTIKGTSGTVNLDPVLGSDPVKFAIVNDASGNSTLYQGVIGAALAATLTPASSGHGDVDSLNDQMTVAHVVGGTSLKIWGLCYAEFPSDLPPDIVTAIDWMCERMYLDDKDVYPRLAEL